MADTEDLKSSGRQRPCGFESRPRHNRIKRGRERVFENMRATGCGKLKGRTFLHALFDIQF